MPTETPTNGKYVTWRELNLSLAPIVRTIDDIQKTVNILHADFFENLGAHREHKRISASRHFWLMTGATLGSALLAALFTFLVTQ